MASPQENVNMAVFCDFENVALGVRDAKIDRFDIGPVLERLLLKGSIVVKKAYCDWERYKAFKASMHEASFELIEIPHVRQSGKNSADIRLVVDALDLCYTKSHVDTFVIVSGDSDFSPLVSKLRENAKKVIGVGVKNSTSDLLVANCDEFIFYDDLVREQLRATARREASAAAKRPAGDERQQKPDMDERKAKAIALAVETLDALVSERGDSGKIWASVLKSAIKRRRPDFSEARYGFRAFGNLLDEAQARGLLEVSRDEKSGAYVSRPAQLAAKTAETPDAADEAVAPRAEDSRGRRGKGRRKERETTKDGARAHSVEPAREIHVAEETAAVEREDATPAETQAPMFEPPMEFAAPPMVERESAHEIPAETAPSPDAQPPARKSPRGVRKTGARKTTSKSKPKSAANTEAAAVQADGGAPHPEAPAAKKAPARSRRPRSKPAAEES